MAFTVTNRCSVFQVVNRIEEKIIEDRRRDLSEAIDKCRKEGQNILIFVGCQSRPVAGFISVEAQEYPGAQRGSIVVGLFDKNSGKLLRIADLDGGATDVDIKELLSGKRQQPQPQPPSLPYQFPSGGGCRGGG
jgi:hypothetical protein